MENLTNLLQERCLIYQSSVNMTMVVETTHQRNLRKVISKEEVFTPIDPPSTLRLRSPIAHLAVYVIQAQCQQLTPNV